MNDPRLWFFVKLLALTVLFYVVLNFVVPLLNLSPPAVLTAFTMAIFTWGLWSLRRIASGGGGG